MHTCYKNDLKDGIVGGRTIKLNIVVLSKFKMLKEVVFRNFCDRQATTGKHLTKMTGKEKECKQENKMIPLLVIYHINDYSSINLRNHIL